MSRVPWVGAVLLGGACLASQSRVNGALSDRIDDGVVAALISFATGLTLLAALAALTPGGRRGVGRLLDAVRSGRLRWWYLGTGVIGAWFVTAQSVAVPVLGVALFTVCVVAGQAVSGMVVDRVGIGVLPAKRITAVRVAGALVTVAAVSLGLVSAEGAGPAVALMLLAFGSGMLVAVQQAFGGQVQHHSGSALAQTLQNFLVGTIVLAVVVAARAIGGIVPTGLPGDWWLYLGGPLGCVFVAIAAAAVHHIGVLMVTLTSVCGQVLGALALDMLAPTEGHALTAWSFAGAGLAIVGVAISAWRRPPRLSPRA